MIVGKEGQPRSGKSYETVKFDILEALKVGRKTYARINGLKHERIADYIGKPLEYVQEHLVILDDDKVKGWLICETQDDGSLVFLHIERGALVVDEVHEYWPVGRQELPKQTVDFFAKHGHVSLDIVLMSQDFKEVHRSVIRRMQRKNLYTKLDALGKDSSYSIRFYTAPAAGKFELMGSEKRDYDVTVFPLYDGIQPGLETQEVYKTGSRTLWQTAKKPAIAVAIALVLGIGAIGKFFFGNAMGEEPPPQTATQSPPDDGSVYQPSEPQPGTVTATNPRVMPVQPKAAEPSKKLPIGIRYILDMREAARARYLGMIGEQHLVEFRPQGGHVMDRMTGKQLQALGWTVEAKEYGLLASYKDEAIIFTAWPVEPLGMMSQQTQGRIREAGPPVMSASESQPAPAFAPSAPNAGSGSSNVAMNARYGQFRNEPLGPEKYEVSSSF